MSWEYITKRAWKCQLPRTIPTCYYCSKATIMSTFLKQLKKYSGITKVPKILTEKQELYYIFLDQKSQMLTCARNGLKSCTIEKLSQDNGQAVYTKQTYYSMEKLKNLGVKVKVQETFSLPPGDRESTGFELITSW